MSKDQEVLFGLLPKRAAGRDSLSSLALSNTNVYEPQIRALLKTAAHFCELVVLKLRTMTHVK